MRRVGILYGDGPKSTVSHLRDVEPLFVYLGALLCSQSRYYQVKLSKNYEQAQTIFHGEGIKTTLKTREF